MEAVYSVFERKLVSLSDLRPGLNARKHFDEAKLKELTDSIKEVGILQEITVRRVAGKIGYEIVFGERRVRAAKKAGLTDIVVLIRDLTDEQCIQLGMMENEERENVNPMDQAEYYGTLIKKYGYDVRRIALIAKRSSQYVAARLQLLKLIEPAKKALWEGKIDLGHALVICQVPEEHQKDLLEYSTPGNSWNYKSADALQRYVNDQLMVKLSGAPWDLTDPLLVPSAGACSLCPKNTGMNQDLFGESGAKARCMDSKCFNMKKQTFLESEETVLRTKLEVPVYQVSTDRTWTDKNVLGKDSYERASKKDATSYAFVVDGKGVGENFPIKLKGAAKEKYEGKPKSKNSPVKKTQAQLRSEAKAKEQLERMNAAQEVRPKVFELVLSKVKILIKADLISIINALECNSTFDEDQKKILAKLMKAKVPSNLFDPKPLMKMSERQLSLIILGQVASEMGIDDMSEWAKLRGVNVPKLIDEHLKLKKASSSKKK
mgnify:CR=1 FL=1